MQDATFDAALGQGAVHGDLRSTPLRAAATIGIALGAGVLVASLLREGAERRDEVSGRPQP